jgi:hypothetical protein
MLRSHQSRISRPLRLHKDGRSRIDRCSQQLTVTVVCGGIRKPVLKIPPIAP